MPKVSGFKKHVRENFTCSICNLVVKGPYSSLSFHLRQQHGLQTSFSNTAELTCGQSGCDRKLSSFREYYYHLHTCERKTCKDNEEERRDILSLQSSHSLSDLCWDNQNVIDPREMPSMSTGHDQQLTKNTDQGKQREEFEMGDVDKGVDSLCASFAKILLKAEAFHKLSQATLNFIAKGIATELGDIGASNYSDIGEANLLLQVSGALDGLTSQHKRRRYYKEAFKYKEAEELVASTKLVTRKLRGISVPKEIPLTFHFISLKHTLSCLFSNPKFCKLVYSEKESDDGFTRGHRDSHHFKTHPLFQKNPFALRLMLFFDEVEVVNPLGSKVKKHEIGMFNFVILNVGNVLNSSLSNIYSFALVRSPLLKDGCNFIFDRLLEEIHELESDEGMQLAPIDSPDREIKVQGTVAIFCADTKGAHQVGGFTGPGSNYFCRACLIHRRDMLKHSTTEHLTLRNRENYQASVEAAKANEQVGGQPVDQMAGIKFSSSLNNSRYFHVTDNCIFDAMHDVLEGVGPFLLMLCLRHWKSSKPEFQITEELLNTRIRNFHYGRYDLKNIPSEKFKDLRTMGYRTGQRAAQNWCLLRNFPLMFGDVIPENDEHFQVILLLLEIIDIIFAPFVAAEYHADKLADLVHHLFELYRGLFPNIRPINKFHHLVHYSDMIKKFGPPVRYWCMRFESFHNIVKQKAMRNGCYKNITKSVAQHLLVRLSATMLDENQFESERVKTGPVSTLSFQDLVDRISDLSTVKWLNENSFILKTSWASLNGWCYRKNTIVLLKYSFNSLSGLPKFGKVHECFIINRQVCLLVEKLETWEFSHHFHAFDVRLKERKKIILVKADNLPECEPLDFVKSYEKSNLNYVCLRHFV